MTSKSTGKSWVKFWDDVNLVIYRWFKRGPLRRTLQALYLNLLRHHGLQLASAMAFHLFLALIPFLALLGWVTSHVLRDNAETLQNLSLWLDLTPNDVRAIVNDHAERFSGLAVAPVALFGALWLASGAFYTVMVAFERTMSGHERAWWERRAIALMCVLFLLFSLTFGAWIALYVGGSPFAVPVLPDAVKLGVNRYLGMLVSGLTSAFLIAGFFRVGVRRDIPRRRIWPGTGLTLVIGLGASYGFALYARNLARYAFYYGSLAAVAVVLAWLWMCSLALLLGAEFNAYLEESDGAGTSGA